MAGWMDILRFDPIGPLVSSGNEAVAFFAGRDLLGRGTEPVERLWELPAATRVLRKQREDGSWKYPGGDETIRSREDYDQLETYRQLGILVEKYGFNRSHPAMERAARFMMGFQTDEGDFRGILGNQYTTHYTGGIMELLIKAGYQDDPGMERGFRWLLSVQQDGGGWTIPMRTHGYKLDRQAMHGPTVQPDRSKPPSHLITGCVLRAFAAHPRYREAEEARAAGEYLASRFFKGDKYPDRRAASYWTKFAYPFWFTDLLSSLDSLSWLGFTVESPQIEEALDWFVGRQREDGLWDLKLLRFAGDKEQPLWIALAICRVMKRFHDRH